MELEAREAYLDLLKRSLTRASTAGEDCGAGRRRRAVAFVFYLLANRGLVVVPDVPSLGGSAVRRVARMPGSRLLARMLARRRLVIVPDGYRSPTSLLTDLGAPAPSGVGWWQGWNRRLVRIEREFGLGWPRYAETMVGLRRLENVERCVIDVLRQDVPGDLVETGVWRGGTAILMRAVLAAWSAKGRRVWLADSFAGLPKPSPGAYPADREVDYSHFEQLAVSEREVRANFSRYGMLDQQVILLRGLFKDTLPTAPIERIAVLRLDGDLYESTLDALNSLYPKLSVGGYCIVDDYGAIPACRQAVDDYRRRHGIDAVILTVGDWAGAYWQRVDE